MMAASQLSDKEWSELRKYYLVDRLSIPEISMKMRVSKDILTKELKENDLFYKEGETKSVIVIPQNLHLKKPAQSFVDEDKLMYDINDKLSQLIQLKKENITGIQRSNKLALEQMEYLMKIENILSDQLKLFTELKNRGEK